MIVQLDVLAWSPVCAIGEIEKMKIIARLLRFCFLLILIQVISFLAKRLESQGKGWPIAAATLPNSASKLSVRNYTALRFRQRTREEVLHHSE